MASSATPRGGLNGRFTRPGPLFGFGGKGLVKWAEWSSSALGDFYDNNHSEEKKKGEKD